MRRVLFQIGTDKYPDAPLSLCVKDVRAHYRACCNYFCTEAIEGRMLLDFQADTAGIWHALQDLNDSLWRNQEPTWLGIHYSGHGSYVPDLGERDEPDGYDECICPVDFTFLNVEHLALRRAITDDDMRAFAQKLPPWVVAETMLDSCHSGVDVLGVRGVGSTYGTPRFIAPPPDMARGEHEPFAAALADLPNVICWTACRAEQVANEGILGDETGGIFTTAFDNLLLSGVTTPTRRELLESVRGLIKDAGYRQIPQLWCPDRFMDLPYGVTERD